MDGSTATQDPLKSQAYSLVAVGNKAYKKPTDATASAPRGGMTDGGALPPTAAAENRGKDGYDATPGRGAFKSVDEFVSTLYGPAKQAADKLNISLSSFRRYIRQKDSVKKSKQQLTVRFRFVTPTYTNPVE
jgi:hypothetical protein